MVLEVEQVVVLETSEPEKFPVSARQALHQTAIVPDHQFH